ncbi:unnamed protein product [Hymenolepis diminuta]|uniref:Fibronectin type-III domain-containing protein n=1 Tax=Hymenolepis diminuta TaxID=6216 RepID=A0A0R3SG16_HYMDI|nr:unnamed protein product [Hymenolepis diminuta]VUZ43973.1 unnamed protein product [Hymenolepis diminuta]
MKNEDSPLMMIYAENGDHVSPKSTHKNGDVDNEIEEPAKKKIHLEESVSNGFSANENKLDNLSRVPSHQLAEQVQDSPILNEFMDPVLLERLKGTIKLRLQGSISQAVKGLLNATQNSIEEGNRLKKMNNDLQRRIKKVEKITQKVQELVSERIPSAVPSTSQNQYYVVEASTNGALISTHSEGVPLSGEVPQPTSNEMQTHIVVETAPLPELDRNNILYESALPPVQPPLRISFHVSSEEGTQLAFEIEQNDYAYEPAESYELYSYASADVDPQIGLTSALWQRVGAIEALPLPIMCKLDYLQPGNVYHFAAFSIDKYRRMSEWSNVATLPVGFPS